MLLNLSLFLTCLPCEIGERMSNAVFEIEDEIAQFDWYSFPLEIQKILPIIIVNVQKPINIDCFGSISATRDTFKEVK